MGKGGIKHVGYGVAPKRSRANTRDLYFPDQKIRNLEVDQNIRNLKLEQKIGDLEIQLIKQQIRILDLETKIDSLHETISIWTENETQLPEQTPLDRPSGGLLSRILQWFSNR